MAPSSAVGEAWGCWSCGAAGPLLVSPCPHCSAELSPVMLASRRAGAALYNDGLAAAMGGFWSEAIDSLERALDLAGPDPGALGLLGLVYYQAGRVAEALAAWGQSGKHAVWADEVRAAPETTHAFGVLSAYNLALGYAHQEKWQAAVSVLDGATGAGSRLAQAHVVKGIAAWAMGHQDQAENAWHLAMELDPSVPGLQTCLVALIEHRSADARFAVAAAAQAASPAEERSPGRSRLLAAALTALTALASGAAWYQYTQAAGARTEAALARSEAARSNEALAEAKASLQKAESSLAQFREAVSKAETEAKQAAAREAGALKVLQAAGGASRIEETEALQSALAEARRLGVNVPGWVEQSFANSRIKAAVERYFEGYRAFMADEYPKAIAAFDASLKLETQVYVADDAAYLAARSAELNGNPAEAVSWYERVLRDFPQSDYLDDALYFGARMAEKAGDRSKALQWYRELLTRFPGSGYDYDAAAGVKRLGQ